MKSARDALTALWILLIPFQDSGLQATALSFLGASPAFIPLALLLGLSVLRGCLYWPWVKVGASVMLIIGYVLLINLVYLLPNEGTSHGTSLIAKTFNLSVLTALILYPVFWLDYGHRNIGHRIQAAFFITLAGIVICDAPGLPSIAMNPVIHYHENLNMRARGFAMECSTLSALLITVGLLSAHYSRTLAGKLFFFLATIVVTLSIGSRGGVLALMTVMVMLLVLEMKSRPWVAVTLILAWATVGVFAGRWLAESFRADVGSFTSSVTRLGLVITSVAIAAHHPFGVGFSGFLPAVDRYAPVAADYMQRVVGSSLNFRELLSYVGAESDLNISTKSMLFDFLAYYGWPFAVLFAWFNYKLMRRLRQAHLNILLLAVGYTCLAISTYVNPIGIYNTSLVYGVAYYEAYRKDRPGSSS